MVFEKEMISFTILEVIALKQRDIHMLNNGRNFNALSFRVHADTVLKTEKAEYHMRDNTVSYVPARLDYSRHSAYDELIVVHFETTDYTTREIECFTPTDAATLSRLFRSMLDCWNQKEVGYRFQCAAILYEIFAECYKQNYRQNVKLPKIQASVDYIHQNYRNSDLPIKEIAEKSFMTEVYFRKLFKKAYGISPQKYIIDLRLQNAAGLIATGYYSLQEVASMSGYLDYKYFSVEFKRMYGVSPSEYFYNYEDKTTALPLQNARL